MSPQNVSWLHIYMVHPIWSSWCCCWTTYLIIISAYEKKYTSGASFCGGICSLIIVKFFFSLLLLLRPVRANTLPFHLADAFVRIHTYIQTLMAVAAVQEPEHQEQFSFLDTSTCRPEELYQQPSDNKMLALPLSHNRPKYTTLSTC